MWISSVSDHKLSYCNFIKANGTYKVFFPIYNFIDRSEGHKEVIDELTCFCTKGGSFLAVSSVAEAKEDPLLSYCYCSYTMKYCDPILMW